jgi:hypothetical protein
MKVLLDECLPLDFRHELQGHDAHTVRWAGFKGMKNGELLQAAEGAGYDVLSRSIRAYLIRCRPPAGGSP